MIKSRFIIKKYFHVSIRSMDFDGSKKRRQFVKLRINRKQFLVYINANVMDNDIFEEYGLFKHTLQNIL